jgi:hypothetical protein
LRYLKAGRLTLRHNQARFSRDCFPDTIAFGQRGSTRTTSVAVDDVEIEWLATTMDKTIAAVSCIAKIRKMADQCMRSFSGVKSSGVSIGASELTAMNVIVPKAIGGCEILHTMALSDEVHRRGLARA